MLKQNKNVLILCVIISLFIAYSCKKETQLTQDSSILTVQTVLGDVTIQSGDVTATPVAGYAIKENSIIKTGKLSIIDIRYKDSGIIRISENTSMDVARLLSTENADETLLQMDEGKVFVTVSKLLKDSKLQVKTSTSVAAVRGTAFRVSSNKGISRVDVLKGEVKVNPVKDDVIIEKIEKIVEPDKTVQIDQKDITKIIEKKKEIEIVTLHKEEIAAIKEEVKLIKIDNTLNEEIKNEIKEIGIEIKPAEEIKDNKEYETELIEQLEKIRIGEETKIKEKEIKDQKAALEEEQKKEHKKKEEQLKAERLRLQRMEDEQRERTRIADEQAKIAEEQEKQRVQKIEEKKKEESRIKNIPNL
ncbi:MAG: FecR domain-containing protein [Spirochaetes bacterium]|nr:FecR domain-containing protein [Spirochaetota bacterium]